MKKIIIMLTLALAPLLTLHAATDTRITFETTTHDFQTIREDKGPVSCEFEFTNTGTEPLIIINATASCGCTRPEFPKKPVAPGKTGKIKVTYNPLGRPGEFNKQITVRTNSSQKKERKITLRITGFVNPAQ